jgi:hypothetical protein
MGRGGARPGAGRKPKIARLLPHPSSTLPTTNGPAEVEEFDAPDSLTREERNVWLKQAPHAFRNGTLTRASALAFERYCRLVVHEQAEAASSARGGGNHRGILKQVNTLELQFGLTASGRPMPKVAPAEPMEPSSKLGRFRR